MRIKQLFFIIFCCLLATSLEALSINERFIQACKDGDGSLASSLLDDGAYIETRDGSDHQTAIVWAAYGGYLSIVKMLVERKANINAQDDKGWTALSEASYRGHIKVVEFLLKNKASTLPSTSWLDSREHGNALFWCVESSHNTYEDKVAIVKLLLEYNAEPEGRNNENLDTLGIAKARNYKEIVDLLQKVTRERLKKLNEYTLLEAIKAENVKKVEECLAKKVNPNILLGNGESILNRAVAMQNASIVRLLLERGANPNTQNNLGTSSLMEAVKHDNLSIVMILLQHGANVNQRDYSGQDALFYAVQSNDINIMTAILNANINIHSANNYGETALLYACRLGNLNAVKLLVNKGASLSITDMSGNTPLHVAVQKNRLDLVQLILRNSGVDPYAIDGNGHNALYYAQKNNSTKLVKLLKTVIVEEEYDEADDTENRGTKDEAW